MVESEKAVTEQPIIKQSICYIPMDRRQALAFGVDLPAYTFGAALFTDISGFTPLAERLGLALGIRQGAEELARILDLVYGALIPEVDRFGGSVVYLGGDSLTCWFDDRPLITRCIHNGTFRATACALAMQEAMKALPVSWPGISGIDGLALKEGETRVVAIKVAIASGPVHRFLVGDPQIQVFDLLAGETLYHMTTAEHLAVAGEIILDPIALTKIGEFAKGLAWKEGPAGEAFATIRGLSSMVEPLPWPVIPSARLTDAQVRPWLLPIVWERLQSGMGEFLTELRPVTALFCRFLGLDYDNDPSAGAKLAGYIRAVQGILKAAEGTLVDITIGDKGNYLYSAFGAPISHEDDARRAVNAALALRKMSTDLDWMNSVQIGISRGTMRTGAYGSASRRVYGVLGDEVNLAARLMSQANPGEILISGNVHKVVCGDPGLRSEGFDFEPKAPIRLKGKAEPLPVFEICGLQQWRAFRLQEPAYTLPMVGREGELELIKEKLALAMKGKGQIIGISGEAGLGKSRLLAEAIRLVRRRGFACYGGACQSDGINSSYLVWGQIWRAFFDLDPGMPLPHILRHLERELEDLVPGRVNALPLLGLVLGIPIPENDFTRNLEAQFRKSALEALLIDCLQAPTLHPGSFSQGEGGFLFVLEDLHWIDPASHDLLERIGRAIVDLPVLILLAYRPPELERLQPPRVEAFPHFTKILLQELSPPQAEQAARAKLAQLYPEWRGAAPKALIERIIAQAEGNPFYTEELLNYLHDRDIDLHQAAALQAIELPSSLQALILSRVDQLSAHQQLTIKAASIIGRHFRFAHLHGYYPPLGEAGRIKDDLDVLAALDLTPLESPEPELAYLFKHIITHEVSYGSLPLTTRAALHEQYAAFLEELVERQLLISPPLDLLAFHYERSGNLAKKRQYVRQAGEAAAARYANLEALEYLGKALDICPVEDLEEQYELLITREKVLGLQAARDGQKADLDELERIAALLGDSGKQVQVAIRRSTYSEATSDFQVAVEFARQAVELAHNSHVPDVEGQAYLCWGAALARMCEYNAAQEKYERALAVARLCGDRKLEGNSLLQISGLFWQSGDYARAADLANQTRQIFQTLGDLPALSKALNLLGISAGCSHKYSLGIDYLEQGLRIAREIGDRPGEGKILGNLAATYHNMGDLARAISYYQQALCLERETEDRLAEGIWIDYLGSLVLLRGDFLEAMDLFRRALEIFQAIGARDREAGALKDMAMCACKLGDYHKASEICRKVLDMTREIDQNLLENDNLIVTALIAMTCGDTTLAKECVQKVLHSAQASEDPAILPWLFFIQGCLAESIPETSPEAEAAFQQAIQVYRSLGEQTVLDHNMEAEALAGLARVCLGQGDLEQALVQVESVLSQIAACPLLYDTWEPLRVYLTCYRVLQAARDGRAREILEQGYYILMDWAANIPSEELRRSFLENVVTNRDLIKEWETMQQA